MFDYINNEELKSALERRKHWLNCYRFKTLLNNLDYDIVFKLVKDDGNIISCLEDKYKNNKEFALESVTYRNFFVRDIENNDPDIPNHDSYMINEIDLAYESLSDELKIDIDIVTQAYKSYKKIVKFLEENNDIGILYNDGIKILLDSYYMIDQINELFIGKYEDLMFEYSE